MPQPAELWDNPLTNALNRVVGVFVRRWLFWLNLVVGLYAILPWLSPLARAWGWHWLGKGIFQAYNPFCHQQPELSYHLLGFQVAYCQRDAALYSAIFLVGLVFALFRQRFRPMPLWALLLAGLPLLLDGLTQAPRAFLRDWTVRTENRWAVVLTGGWCPDAFYVGDDIGHLNWWLRTVSGALFGLGLVLALYPRIEAEMRWDSGLPVRPSVPGGSRSRREMYVGTCPPEESEAVDTPVHRAGADPGPESQGDRRHKQSCAAGTGPPLAEPVPDTPSSADPG